MGFFDGLLDIIGIGSDIYSNVKQGELANQQIAPGPAEIQQAEAIKMAMGIAPQPIELSGRVADIATMLERGESDPRFRSLVDEDDARRRMQYIQGIDAMMLQDRRGRIRSGRKGINDERQDEVRAAVLTQSFEDSRQASRDHARALLAAAANTNNVAIGGLTSVMGQLTGAGSALAGTVKSENANATSLLNRQTAFTDALPTTIKDIGTSIGGLLSGGTVSQPTTVSNNPTTSSSIWT